MVKGFTTGGKSKHVYTFRQKRIYVFFFDLLHNKGLGVHVVPIYKIFTYNHICLWSKIYS